MTCGDAGQLDRADQFANRASSVAREFLGPNHPSVGLALAHLAQTSVLRGDYSRATPLIRQALSTSLETHGAEHPFVAMCHCMLGACLSYYVDEVYEAESQLKTGIAILEKTLGPEHPDIARELTNLAALYAHMGRIDESLALTERALAIQEKSPGRPDAEILKTLDGYAYLLWEKKRTIDATVVERRAEKIRSRQADATARKEGTKRE